MLLAFRNGRPLLLAFVLPPVAFHRSLRKFLVNSVESLSAGALRYEASPFRSASLCVFRKSRGAVCAIATHIDHISGRGEPDLLFEARRFLEKRFGKLRVQEMPLARVGVEVAQGHDFSATLTQEDFTEDLKLSPTSPKLREGRKEPPSTDETDAHQRKLGELRWVATVSRLAFCAQ